MLTPSAGPAAPRKGFLERLGLHRPELRAWAMYDWANSAMVTTIVTAVFPIYFSSVACAQFSEKDATAIYAVAMAVGLLIVAVLAPILAALADYTAVKKKMLGGFLGLGVAATACMFFIHKDDWLLAAFLFILAEVGASGSIAFYDALLPHVAKEDEIDRVSTAGYALGYVGGGLLLALNAAWIQWPQWFGLPHGPGLTEAQRTLPMRLAFLSVAVWWLLFSIPLFLKVPEPPVKKKNDLPPNQYLIQVAFTRLRETLGELRNYKPALIMLLAFLIYNDGIGAIYRLASSYAKERKIDNAAILSAILLVQFVGIPFAFLFGSLAEKIGSKPSIFIGLTVYLGISVFGYFMETETHFFILAALVAMVQGGTQALSRSLFAGMIPKKKSAEFFSFFAVGEKFAGILGPLLFAAVNQLTGGSQNAIVSIIVFFIVGGAILYFVDVEKGKQLAQAANSNGTV